jgi:hypothetical protein
MKAARPKDEPRSALREKSPDEIARKLDKGLGFQKLNTASIQRRGSVNTLRFVSIEAGTGTKIIPATLALPIRDVAWTGRKTQ